MSKLYVIPLGFQVDYVVRFLIRVGIGSGDAVLALLPEQSGGDERARSEKALRDLGDFLRRIGELSVIPEYVNTRDSINLVIGIFDAVMKHVNDYDFVIIAITGGVRAFSAASPLIAAMLRKAINKEVRLFVVSENLTDYLDLTEALYAFEVVEPSEGLIDVLRAIQDVGGLDKCVGVDEVAERLGKDSSTVRRQLYDLEDMKLVVGSGSSRHRCFSLTGPGRILARLYANLQSRRKAQ